MSAFAVAASGFNRDPRFRVSVALIGKARDDLLMTHKLSRGALAVFNALTGEKHFDRSTSQCGYSKAEIADAAGVSLATVYRALLKLESLGLVSRFQHRWGAICVVTVHLSKSLESYRSKAAANARRFYENRMKYKIGCKIGQVYEKFSERKRMEASMAIRDRFMAVRALEDVEVRAMHYNLTPREVVDGWIASSCGVTLGDLSHSGETSKSSEFLFKENCNHRLNTPLMQGKASPTLSRILSKKYPLG